MRAASVESLSTSENDSSPECLALCAGSGSNPSLQLGALLGLKLHPRKRPSSAPILARRDCSVGADLLHE